MDHLADFLNFKRMVMRLCTTFDKFATDELIETWWKVLRDEQFRRVEASVDAFIATASDKTKFPKPAQFRATAFVSDADSAKYHHETEKSKKTWQEFMHRFPTTGPLRLKLAQASQILASTYEHLPAHAQAMEEYLHIEKMLGEKGRFSADC